MAVSVVLQSGCEIESALKCGLDGVAQLLAMEKSERVDSCGGCVSGKSGVSCLTVNDEGKSGDEVGMMLFERLEMGRVDKSTRIGRNRKSCRSRMCAESYYVYVLRLVLESKSVDEGIVENIVENAPRKQSIGRCLMEFGRCESAVDIVRQNLTNLKHDSMKNKSTDHVYIPVHTLDALFRSVARDTTSEKLNVVEQIESMLMEIYRQ